MDDWDTVHICGSAFAFYSPSVKRRHRR